MFKKRMEDDNLDLVKKELADLRQTYHNRIDQNKKFKELLYMREQTIKLRESNYEYYVARIAELENELEEVQIDLEDAFDAIRWWSSQAVADYDTGHEPIRGY